MKKPCMYILASRGGTLYIGVTNDLQRRVHEHQEGLVAGFTSRYNVTRLVSFEEFPTMLEAIVREKRLKGWRRHKKVALVEARNPRWRDLGEDWRYAG